MRHDIVFNYDYLIDKITNKYKESTLNKNILALCKDTYYLTPYKFKLVVISKRTYFLSNDIYKISKVLDLSDEEVIKCFFTKEDIKN